MNYIMLGKTYNIRPMLLNKPPKNGKYYMVAIDGRGGSGKTTLSKYLQSLLPDFCFICADEYFEPISHPIAWGGYNEERFYNDVIRPLSKGQRDIDFRPYNWDHEPHIVDHRMHIDKGVFIDRCYSFSFDLGYDLKIWVETPREEALSRGVSRSTMPKETAEKVWRELWKPMEDRYIASIKPVDTADILIYGNQPFDQRVF